MVLFHCYCWFGLYIFQPASHLLQVVQTSAAVCAGFLKGSGLESEEDGRLGKGAIIQLAPHSVLINGTKSNHLFWMIYWRWFLLWIMLSTAAFCIGRVKLDGHFNSPNYIYFWAYLAFPYEHVLHVEDSYSHRRQLKDEGSLESWEHPLRSVELKNPFAN